MKVTLNQVEEAIESIAGELGVKVYKALKGKENVNEFLIAENLGVTINEIRNAIYKMDEYGLLESTRNKDRKKGWYIYFWTFDLEKAKKMVIDLKTKTLAKLKERLAKEEESTYYVCPEKCHRMTEEEALEQGYMCPECGNLLQPEDADKKVKNLKRVIKTMEDELVEISN